MQEANTYSEEESRYFMWRWQWRRRIAIAQGEYPPHLLLKGGQVLNVFTGELIRADVAIDAGRVAAIGTFEAGHSTIDVSGCVVAPSFIDPHFHLESTLLWPPEIARAVIPRGTGAIITDPHEMANVAGVDGVSALRDATRGLPLDIHFTVPSCVPASPLESPGATFGLAEIENMLAWPETVALGELMNFPGVLQADIDIAAKLWATRSLPRDGHAPGLGGRALDAYVGAGISSDHESVTLAEGREKLRAGMMLMLREGTSERNLLDLLPLVTDETWPRVTFASDDRDCHDLLTRGHMDDILRTAIGAGLDPVRAITMATWNPARHWRLGDVGAVASGYWANLVVLSDLESITVRHTIHRGRVVATDGELTVELARAPVPELLRTSVNVAPVRLSHLQLSDENRARAVEVVPGQIVTRYVELGVGSNGALPNVSVENDLLKLVSVERHHATGRTGIGLVRGFGLQRGAIASTVAHDAHNIVAVGASDADILAAIATVAESQGGMAVVADQHVLAHLPLPVAGLVSDSPLEAVAKDFAAVEDAARSLGCHLPSPFGQLVFLSLSVIPEARVTDRGFLDLRPETGS